MEQPISARFDSYFARSRFLLSLPLPPPPIFCPQTAKTRSGDEITVCPERETQYKVELRLRNVVLRLKITARDWFKQFWLIGDLHCKGFLCVISETDHCAHSTRPFFLAVLIQLVKHQPRTQGPFTCGAPRSNTCSKSFVFLFLLLNRQ